MQWPPMKDIFLYTVQDELFGTLINLAYEPHEVCGMVLGSECGPPWNPELMWNVTLPDTPKPPIVPPSLPKVRYSPYNGAFISRHTSTAFSAHRTQ